MNLIVTGGYGANSEATGYADIDWSKETYAVTFQIADVYALEFVMHSTALDFGIVTSSNNFNINTYNETFKIETHNFSFTANVWA